MRFPLILAGGEHAADLPHAVDLVVIGGGVIGVCTALYAARGGASVLLLEKGRVAAEQSSRNWGWIRVQGRDMAEIPIALRAQDQWRDLDAQCHGRLGVETVGVTYLAETDADMAAYEEWLQEAKPRGVSSELLERKAAARLMQYPHAGWQGALHTPTDMKGEPWVAVPELARLAASEGVMIREKCAVRGLDMRAGHVAGVVTEAGRVRCERVVLAGGAWSSLFLRRHGVSIPQLSVRSTALATTPVADLGVPAGVDADIAFRRRADGGYTLAPAGFAELYTGPDTLRHLPTYLKLALEASFDVWPRGPQTENMPDAFRTPRHWTASEQSPFERCRILDPGPNMKMAAATLERFEMLYPQLGPLRSARIWGGMIDVLPDVVPVVDQVDALPGLVVCTGMCGHGFGIGPGFGRITADIAMGRDPDADLDRFRLSRFSDGSPMVPGPNI
ncbi:FAD-binding oxidoreductase [Sagittula sp. NFXS13]|uniref:NAD(P)/FAD-dependent oxidoreductase n=1 Tax=Sagittula sp. NFXS13 TaxID=2819095 RepID=UPI0032DE2BF9